MKKSTKILTAALAATAVASGISYTASVRSAYAAAESNSLPARYLRTVETDAEGWTFDGFNIAENAAASRLFEHGTFAAGSTAEYRFKSDYIELVGYKGPEGGALDIEIDGVKKSTVSLAGAADAYRSTLASYELDLGWHTVKITSTAENKWHAIDCLRVALDKTVYENNYNLALVGDIICSVQNPTGGGNKDLNTIRNEKYYAVGTSAGPLQYDSFHGSGREMFYMGYSYKEEMTFAKLVFQEGATWATGGWFADGDVKTQVRTDAGWTDVKLKKPVGYPVGDSQDAFGENCETYVFEFEPIKGNAIRIVGTTGGTENFVSVAQIEVYGSDSAETLADGYNYKKATVYETSVTPDDPNKPDKPDDPGKPDDANKPTQDGKNAPTDDGVNLGLAIGLPIGLVGAAAILAGTYIYVNRKKNKTAEAKKDDGSDGEDK